MVKRLYVPLPEKEARLQIVHNLVKKEASLSLCQGLRDEEYKFALFFSGTSSLTVTPT